VKTKALIRDFIYTDIAENNNGQNVQKPLDKESLIEKGILDSLGIIKLLSFIEANFYIKVTNNDITPDNFESINTISSFVESQISVQ
jgi:acyl carrier protein